MSIPRLPDSFGKPLLERALGLSGKATRAKEPVKEGRRHNATVRFAASRRNKGVQGEELRRELLAFNDTCSPPMGEDEVLEIAKWADSIDGCDGFARNDKGQIVRDHLGNVTFAVKKLGVTLRYDAFADRISIAGMPEGFDGMLNDATVRRLWFLVEENFGFRPSKDFFLEAVYDLARQNAFDSLCEELDRLEAAWDGIHRLDRWLIEYAGAMDTPLVRAMGAKTLLGAVRRARQPGVKFDTMLVLVSEQGSGKSTACSILAGGPERFSDYVPFGANPREVIEALSGRWIIEEGELAGMGKASSEKRKSFLSRSVDHGRAAYARVPTAVPRRGIFIGTTNKSAFLTDGTGNRRFWPVEVDIFDLEALARDRDQLIGEAAAREAAGESITLPSELWSVAAAEQEARRVENPIVSKLQDALGDQTGRIKSTDLWELLDVPTAQQKAMAETVNGAMQELGWKYGQYRFGEKNARWGYAKGDDVERQRRLTVNFLRIVEAVT